MITKKAKEIYSNFSANEKAIIDGINNNLGKELLIRLTDLKHSLQFTGWLQYLVPLPVVVGLLIFGSIAYLLNGRYIGHGLFILGGLLITRILFDIVTVKYKIRLPESRPKRNEQLNQFELMRLRHSTRSFQKNKLSESDLSELMNFVAKRLSEDKFSDNHIKIEYISKPIKVWPTVNATEFLVAIAPKKYDRLAILDVGRTLQKVVIDATKMGLHTCWIGPGADHGSITSQLDDSFDHEKDNIICVCAVGYESKYSPLFLKIFNKKMRQRKPIEALFFKTHEMEESIDIDEKPYYQYSKAFEACQYAPSSFNGQTTRGIVTTDQNTLKRMDFLAVTTSRYYAAIASGIWCGNWELSCEALNIQGEFKKFEENEISLSKENPKDAPIYDMTWQVK